MISDQDLLKLASKLAVSGGETEWRSAASRAYFAAYHRTRTLIHALGFGIPRGDQSHAYLWRRLQGCKTSAVGDIGSLLKELRNSRNRADYDLDEDFPRDDAKYAVEAASDILHFLDNMTPEDRQIAMQTMRDFERDVLRETTWRQRPR